MAKLDITLLGDEPEVLLDILKAAELQTTSLIVRREGDRSEHELKLGHISYIRGRIVDALVTRGERERAWAADRQLVADMERDGLL